jgi:ADP-ribose pyrophosphatase YjhB (NUDIX family)
MGQAEHDQSHSGGRQARQAPQPNDLDRPQIEPGGRPPEMRSLRARLVTRAIHAWFVLTRAMTFGVRAACFDENGRVFLVRHSYVPGWHMPGGGVERGQTAAEALLLELREEGNLEVIGEPALLALFFNPRTSRRDHVAFYRCKVRQTEPKLPDAEIVDTGFFALDALPDGTTSATLRRLDELAGKRQQAHIW